MLHIYIIIFSTCPYNYNVVTTYKSSMYIATSLTLDGEIFTENLFQYLLLNLIFH